MTALQSFVAEAHGRGLAPAVMASWDHTRHLLNIDEVHTWSELGLIGYGKELASPDEVARRPNGSGLHLIEGTTDHLSMVDLLPTVSRPVAARRLEEGVRWWLLVDGDEPVFSCWTFSRFMRMIGAPGGGLILPPHVTFLEDSVTNPARRGCGAGPVALTQVCRRLGEEGWAWILTKVKVGDRAPERMIAKIGFIPMATVRIWRKGPVRRTWVVMAAGANNGWVPGALGAANAVTVLAGSSGPVQSSADPGKRRAGANPPFPSTRA